MTEASQIHRNKRRWILIFAVAILATFILAYPVYIVLDFRYYYGQAEPVADGLNDLYVELDGNLNRDYFEALLNVRRFEFIKSHDLNYADDEKSLFLWVRVNQKYTVGLHHDGRIDWQFVPDEQEH